VDELDFAHAEGQKHYYKTRLKRASTLISLAAGAGACGCIWPRITRAQRRPS
jgi:hypothetical protein